MLAVLALAACQRDPAVGSAAEPVARTRVEPRAAPPAPGSTELVGVRGSRFVVRGQPLYVTGLNYWFAAQQSRAASGRERVVRELDRLRAMGVGAVRVLALSEGPEGEPWRVRPAAQPAPGVLRRDALSGLDWLLDELWARGMRAILTLTNFWFWSGGVAQYRVWAGAAAIPYPDIERATGWEAFEDFAAEFFVDAGAKALFRKTLDQLVPRYAGHPGLFAWELINEPRGRRRAAEYRRWLDESARYVKALDPSHLVTTGSEGDTPWPRTSGLDATRDHQSPAIDFVSFHVWPENWGWFRPREAEPRLSRALALAEAYVERELAAAAALGKPALLLETGLSRDAGRFEPAASTDSRDRYFERLFDITLRHVQACGRLGGSFPWAWSGENVPLDPGGLGGERSLTGDPPHERQGWYGIYARDRSTVALIRDSAARIASAAARCASH